MLRSSRTRLLLGAVAALLALLGAAAVVWSPGGQPDGGDQAGEQAGDAAGDAAGRDCPPGYRRPRGGAEPAPSAAAGPEYQGVAGAEPEQAEPEEAEREGAGAGEAGEAPCGARKHPEPFGELAVMNGERAAKSTAPFTHLRAGAYAAAVAERDALLAAPDPVAGTDAQWTPLGSTPLLANEPGYDEVNGLGLAELNGRIQDFALVPGGTTLYAAVANGGVWRSDDLGGSWRSVGDGLPTQVVGSIAWTPAGGGTLVAVTGDGAFGGNSLGGLGVWRSTDEGATWTRSAGPPDGALGFKAAVDPTDPSVVYAATGAGLFRSTDAGATFTDVRLPTGSCAGRTADAGCFFANMVTDVVVQAPDRFGNAGGAVLAAVGWRAGAKPNADGTVQSPGNGLYASPDGRPGTFARTGTSGFAPQARIGRVELGAATGPDQNHDYVYALVQDAVRFNGGAPVIDVPEEVSDLTGPLPNITVLNGVYVSADFGATWALMATAEALQAPTTGSALIGTAQAVARYGPGVQSWYNEFILPDPTRQVAGVPTRLVFGLEEVWQSELTTLPLNGLALFKVIGRYFSGTTCLFLNLEFPTCPTNRQLDLSTTTHPDQHGAVYVPEADGGVTLVVGGDGGVYTQRVGPGEEFDNTKWGVGANRGFNTLLPYDAVMAKDGTVWSGLQDNGEMKITPEGRQIQTFGGDAFFSAVDPDNSDIAYEESPSGRLRVTTDGGRTWRSIDPQLQNAAFSTPFAMDPGDARHLLIAGRNVRETAMGPDTVRESDPVVGVAVENNWRTVFDLGTKGKPGVAPADDPLGIFVSDDPQNRASAIDLEGDAAYIGFCGYCDTVTQGTPFANGLATNVGGDRPPKRLTSDGWHIAAAAGLPARIVNSVAIDPADPRTVYVALGGYARKWAPPGAVGDDVSRVGSGHVFKSTDAGETFRDISGNLPDVPASWVELRGGQLLLATDVGVFASADTDGSRWSVLGRGLPTAPVSTVRLAPHNSDIVVVASYGRGVWTYRFPPGVPGSAAPLPVTGDLERPRVTPPTGAPAGLLPTGLALALAAAAALALRRRGRSVEGAPPVTGRGGG